MTEEMKLLAFFLMKGDGYLMQRVNTRGQNRYMYYEGNMSPKQYFKDCTVRKFRSLLKTDNKGRITLNINMVRQLHGKSYLKKLYKNLKTTI